MKRFAPVLIVLIFTTVACLAAVIHWNLNSEQSKVNFKIKNFGKNVNGSFAGMKANIIFDEKNLQISSIQGSIDVNTIDTGIKKRDKDLKSADYFDSGTYPEITFKSKNISKSDNGYIAQGDLTIKDVTKEVEMPFTFENQGKHGIFKGTLTLDRRDYHVGGKSRILADHVEVEIVADATQDPATSM